MSNSNLLFRASSSTRAPAAAGRPAVDDDLDEAAATARVRRWMQSLRFGYNRDVEMPRSATEAWICYVAVVAFFPALLTIKAMGVSHEWRLVLVAAAPAIIVIMLEALYTKPATRPSTGLQFQTWKPEARVVLFKLLGFNSILAAIGFFYYVTNEYSRDLYTQWFVMLRTIGPYAWVGSLIYFVVVDGYQTAQAKREDLYHNLGLVLAQQPTAAIISQAKWENMAREYLVKLFFLPLMASFYSSGLRSFESSVAPFVDRIVHGTMDFVGVYAFLHDTMYFVDVMWATSGYMLSCKLLDSHVRSAEPTFLGWTVALGCYPPFVYSVLDAYCTYNSPKNAWGVYFKDSPRWIFWIWGLTILFLTFVYCWATIIFGLRFSNLTNRGIITNGPYAFLRHPAYVCKNLSWWMVAVPWSLHDGWAMAFKRCVRLGLINVIYWARAKTEERHLLQDGGYVGYYNAIQERYKLPTLPGTQQQQQQQQQQQEEGDEEHGRLLAMTNGRHVQ